MSYLDSCNSGQTNSNTSLVGSDLIFSDLRAGMDSSKTQPLNGRRSQVRTNSRYIHWSFPYSLSGSMFRGWIKVSEPGRPPLAEDNGTFSRRIETATAPKCSSTPNQF